MRKDFEQTKSQPQARQLKRRLISDTQLVTQVSKPLQTLVEGIRVCSIELSRYCLAWARYKMPGDRGDRKRRRNTGRRGCATRSEGETLAKAGKVLEMLRKRHLSGYVCSVGINLEMVSPSHVPYVGWILTR